MIKVLESENINYVKVAPNLINDYLKMYNNKDTQKFINSDEYHEFSFDDEMNWVKSKMEEKDKIFSMIEKSTNEYIGNIELMEIKNNIGELGICLTKDKCDKHYGTESIKKMVDYWIKLFNLDTIDLNVHGDNKRAIKCYENCGFVIDGEGKHKGDFHMTYKGDKND